MLDLKAVKLKTPDELANDMIKVALKGEHSPLEFIGSEGEYRVAKTLKKILKEIVKGFRQSADKVLNDYLAKLKNGIDDAKCFPVYKTYKYCEMFFKNELIIIKETISEYKVYRSNRGYLACYFNEVVRTPEERQIDFRTGKRSPYTALALAESALESFDDIFKKEI